MAMNNLTIDGEFRYIIQWFNEWSELQRDDFVPVLVEYLLQGSPGEVYMNGMVNSVTHAGIQDKPMSLFQCRIKLFREWNKKWPLELKHKLQQKIMEIDSKVAEKITKEIKTYAGGEQLNILTNGCNGNGSDFGEGSIESSEIGNGENGENGESNAATTTTDIVEETIEQPTPSVEGLNLDSQIVAVLNNETPVDENITTDNADNTNSHTTIADSADSTTATTTLVNTFIDGQICLEPAEQVQTLTHSQLEDNNIDADCSATTTATVA